MNRDERITRGPGKPPEIHVLSGTKVVYPSDGDDGTWIGANEHGISLALLNWNDIVPRGLDAGKTRSRGRVIPALMASGSLAELHSVFAVSNLKGMLPFRLVGVFASEKEIWEWRWDSTQLDPQSHGWESRHWFSSSLSDQQAESLRGSACRDAQSEPDAGSVPWLRRLHSSHRGGPGPFSVCVHRKHVKTLSYTEVISTPKAVSVEHFMGSPCSMRSSHLVGIQRVVGMGSSCTDLASHAGI